MDEVYYSNNRGRKPKVYCVTYTEEVVKNSHSGKALKEGQLTEYEGRFLREFIRFKGLERRISFVE